LLLHVIPVFFLWRGLLRSGPWRWIALGCTPLVVWATLQTLSRAGLVSLGIGLASLLVASVILARTAGQKKAALATLLATPLLVGLLAWNKPEFVQDRIDAYVTRANERADTTGSLLADRLLWLSEVQTHNVSDHLLHPFGMGYQTFQTGNGLLPHNTFVDVYIIAGPIAFLIYLMLFGNTLVGFARGILTGGSHLSQFARVHLLTFGLTQVLLLVSLSVFTWKVNWLLLGIALGFFSSAERRPECRS
jgi:hypothetical protein